MTEAVHVYSTVHAPDFEYMYIEYIVLMVSYLSHMPL